MARWSGGFAGLTRCEDDDISAFLDAVDEIVNLLSACDDIVFRWMHGPLGTETSHFSSPFLVRLNIIFLVSPERRHIVWLNTSTQKPTFALTDSVRYAFLASIS